MADNLDKLYGEVSAKFDIGDAEAFKAKMQTPEDRKKFYDVVSGKGFDLGDYNSYETRLGGTTSVQKKSPIQTGGEKSTVVAEQVTQPSAESGETVEAAVEVESLPTNYDRLSPKSYSNLKDGTNYFTGSIRNGKPVVKKWDAASQEFQTQNDPAITELAQQKFGKPNQLTPVEEQKDIARKGLTAKSDTGSEIILPETSEVLEKAGVATYLNKDKIADEAAVTYNRTKSIAQQPQVSTYMQMFDLYKNTDDPTVKDDIEKQLEELKSKPFNYNEINSTVEGKDNPSLQPLMPSIPELKTVGDAVSYAMSQMEENKALIDDYANTENDLLKINEEYQKLSPQDPKGFWYNAIRTVNEHTEALDKANKIALNSDQGAMEELENTYIKSKIFPKQPTEGLGTAGELAGGMAAAVAPTVGATMAATALTGNPIAGMIAGGVYSAQDMARLQYANGFQEMYNEMREKNPNLPPNIAYETAKDYAKQTAGVQGTVGAAVGMFLPALRTESVLAQKASSQIAKQFFVDIAKNSGFDFGVGASSQMLNNYIGKNLGSDRSIFDGALESGGMMAVQGLMVSTLTHGFPAVSKYVTAKDRENAVNFLANSAPEKLETVFGNAIKNGSSPIEIQNLRDDVMNRMAAFSQMPPNLSAEKKIKLAPLYEERNRLATHLKDNPASEMGVMPEIERIDRQIAEEAGFPLTEKEAKRLEDLNAIAKDKEDRLTPTEIKERNHLRKRNTKAEKEAAKDVEVKPVVEKEIPVENVAEGGVEEPVEKPAAEQKPKTGKQLKEEHKVFKEQILAAEPTTPRQFIMQWFAGGGKMKTAEFKDQTGFTKGAEFGKRIWAHTNKNYFMRDRAGMRVGKEVKPYSLDDIISMVQNEWKDNHGGELDYLDVKNEVIDVLRSHESPSGMIENLREDFSDREGNIIADKYDRAAMRNEEAQEAMGVFESPEKVAEDEPVKEAYDELDAMDLDEKDISSIDKFISKFTDANGEVDYTKALEAADDVFNEAYGELTSKAAKQIEKIIADGKAKKDSGKQGENLPEGDGGAQDNGRENKGKVSESEKIIREEYSQKLADADAKIEAAKQAKQSEVNAINKRANLFGGDTGAEKNKGLFGAQKDDYAQIEKITAEHDKKIAEAEIAKQKLVDEQDKAIKNAVDIEKRQQKLFGKDKVADGLNDLDNIVNENRIAEEYNDVREDAKNEYEKELDRHLEDLREAYSSASRTEAGLRKLQEKTPSRIGGFVKRLLTGTTPEDVVASKARLAEMQKQYRKDKADLRALLPRERGSNFVVEKLSRAARTGEISQETADLAIDLIKKNPDIFEDLAISITKKPSGNEGLQGWYRAADALVKVFKNPSDPTTAVHEVLHHTERFLPHDIRDNIIKEWNKEVELQKDSLAKKLKNEKDVSKRQEITTGLLYLELAQARQAEPNYSNVVAMERIMSKYLGDHTDSQGNFHKGLGDSWYQLFNPSEWWAVNASRLFREAKNKPELKTWTDKAKAFYNYLIQSAKRIFKGSPTEAVEKGLKAVLDGQTLEDRQGSQLSTSKKLIGNSQNDAGLNQLIIPEKKPKVIDALARIGKGLIEAKEAKIDDVIEKIKAYVLSKSKNITGEDVDELKGEILDKINISTISEEPLNAKNIDKAVAKKLKEETREAGRDLIRKRRASIDSENLKTELYAQSLEKQTTKEQREVLPFILEKTNVPEKLGRPDLVETLKNDKAKLEPIAAQIREHFDKMWEKIVANTENLDAEQIKDYVTHIWDIPKDKTEQVANWFSTKNRFLNKRYISTIEEGVDLFGLKPKVLDIAQIIRIHDSVANTVIANGEFVTDLKTMSRDGMPLIIRADKSPEGWVTVDHPAMSSPLVIPGENGKANVVIKLPYKVHPDLAEPVKAIFGKKIDSKFLDNYMKADGVMKKIGLSVSLFHHGALSETAIALMGPVKAVTAIGKLGKAAIVNKFEGTPLAQFPNEAVDAINSGVKFGHTLDINTGAVNGILEKIASKTKDIPVAGKAAELLSSFNEKWDTGLWNYLHDGLKLYAFMDAKTKMPENTANKKQYLQEHAQLINDYFGGQNWDVLLTSPRAQQIMRLALLSPDWTISKLRLAGAPVGLGAMSKDAKYVRAKASGMFWVKAAIYYGVGLNLMNAYFRKQDRKEHPEYYPEGNNSFMDNTMFGNTVGHKTHLFTGRYEDGSEMYRRWGKEFRELPELFMNEDGVSFPKPLLEKAGGKMAPAAQIVSKLMTGNSLGGYEDWDLKDKKGWAWTAGAMKVIAKGYTPMSTGNFFRDDKEWKPADLMFPGGKGMTKSKTIDLFKKGIDQGDEAYVKEIYSGAVRNNLDAYGLFKTAIQSSNAEKTKELMQGIKTVDDVKQKIRGTTDKEEKQKLFRKLRKFEIENKQKHQANKLWKEAEKELRE